MKKLILFFYIVFFASYVFSQNIAYSVLFIPDSLIENSNACIRKDKTILTINNTEDIVLKVHKIITVFNKSADDLANIQIYYDSFSKVNSITGTVYDKMGDKIKKIKKSDIEDYSAVSGSSFVGDGRIKYYSPQIATYPYTIEYEYEQFYEGYMFLPTWEIYPNYNVSIQSSSFLINSNKENFRYYEKNFDKCPQIESNSNETINSYSWSVKNIKSIIEEPYCPDYNDFLPMLFVGLNAFKMSGYEGNMDTWENLGKWIYKLNTNRDILAEETKNQIHELISEISDTTEIVKILYEFMQSKTRYVSIQLGIGGWQPFEASFVDEKGYGDCKALSNYMYSILKEAGIKSHYTLVKAGENSGNIVTEFPKSQFNHAILCVPMKNDTIWLECTSQKNPFGYIGTFTDNRNVLIVDENGGKIVKTKEYHQNENIKSTKATILIDSIGFINADIDIKYSGLMYDEATFFLYQTNDEQKKYLYQTIDIPDFKINNYDITEIKDIIPSLSQNLEISSENYATCSGKRIFIPLNMINKITKTPEAIDNRNTNIVLKRPYIICDTLEFIFPENFEIEYLTSDNSIVTEFGEYSIKVENENNKILYIRNLKMNKGEFSPEKYSEFIDFHKQIMKFDSEKIVIKKI